MNRVRISVLLAVVAALATGLMPTVASAASLKWHVRSEHSKVTSLEFYSQDRDYVWPGGGEVYVIEDYDEHTYTLSCNKGEKICYGAWVPEDDDDDDITYWGAGKDGDKSCSRCCFRCLNQTTNVINLDPSR